MVGPPKDDELKPDSAPTPLPTRGNSAKAPPGRGSHSPDEETTFDASAAETRVERPDCAPTPPAEAVRSAETQVLTGPFVKREIEKLFDTSLPVDQGATARSARPAGEPRGSKTSTDRMNWLSGEPPDTERPTQWMRPGQKPDSELPEEDRETATRLGARKGVYKLVNLIGRGGGGEVWEAEQCSLGRIVAAKKMHRGRIEATDTSGAAHSPSHPSGTGSGGVAYFRRLFAFQHEALIGGALEHPNILPVYDLGQDEEGAPLIAMRRVRGRSWARLMAEEMATTPPEDFINRHVGILVQVAQAVAFAHSRGIIHRDIKPTQVMIGEYGEVQLMDWGLAIVLDPALLPPEWRPDETPLEPTVAMAANPAGTPAFMAPEQARVGTEELGPWTDVFLLGATLFFVLTGEPPNTGRSSPQVVLQAAKGQYRNLMEVAGPRPVPAQLAALVTEAMEVDWKRRRLTAREFARRLTDFLLGYSRRPESEALADQAEEMLGRNPLDYKTLAAALTTLVTARGLWPGNPRLDVLQNRALSLYAHEALGKDDLILARVQAERLPAGLERAGLLAEIEEAERHRRRREAERRRAIVAARVLMGGLVLSLSAAVWQWTRAQRELEASEKANAIIRSKEAAASAAREAMEREAYFSGIGYAAASIRDGNPDRALDTLVRRVPEHLRAWEWGALAGMLNSDDATLMRGVVKRQNSALFHSDIAPDGATMAVAASRGVVMIWDMATLRPLRQFTLPTRGVWCVDHSPDGSRLLAAGLDGKGFIIDAVTGDILCELPVHSGVQSPILRGAAWSPDGTMIATSGNTTPLTVANAETGEVMLRHWVEAGTYDVAWSPDSRHIAVATRSPVDPFVLDVTTGEVAFSMPGDLRTVLSVNYSPDGRLVAVATVGGRVAIHSSIDGARVREIGHLYTSVRSVAFTPDSQLLAAVGASGHIWLHDVASGRLVHEFIGARQMEKLTFHPTRNLLVGTAFDELKIWNLDRILPRRMADDRPPADVVARSARMRLISFPGERSTVWQGYDDQWIGGRGRTVLRAENELAIVDSFYTATSPDGRRRVEVGYEDRTLRLYDNKKDEFLAELMGPARAFFADFTPDGQWLAVSMRAGEVRFFHTSNWREEPRRMVRLPNPNDLAFSLAFTRDGLMAMGSALGALEVRNMATGEQLWYRGTAHDRSKAIVKAAFSPDGGRLATASSDETARVWDTRTGELLLTLAGHGLNVLSVAWHPDGKRLLTVGMDDTAKLWDTETGREIVTLLATQGQTRLMGGTFSPDGHSAFIANNNGTVTRIDTLAWQERLAQCGEADELLRCIELVKRQTRLNPATTEADILW